MVLAVLQIAELPVSVILLGDGVTHLHAGLDNLEQVVRLNVMDERSDGFRTCIADVRRSRSLTQWEYETPST
jgi:hypothetical protein